MAPATDEAAQGSALAAAEWAGGEFTALAELGIGNLKVLAHLVQIPRYGRMTTLQLLMALQSWLLACWLRVAVVNYRGIAANYHDTQQRQNSVRQNATLSIRIF